MPAPALIIVQQEHVVSEDRAKGERLVRRRLLRVRGLGDGDLGQGGLLDAKWMMTTILRRHGVNVAWAPADV